MNPAENYILKQQEPFLTILLQLQVIIEKTIPELDLKHKWKIPFYYINNKPFCFLNVSKNYVDLGIVSGFENQIYKEKLVSKNRTKMVSLRYFDVDDVESDILISVLQKSREFHLSR